MKFQKDYREYINELGQKIKTYRIMNDTAEVILCGTRVGIINL